MDPPSIRMITNGQAVVIVSASNLSAPSQPDYSTLAERTGESIDDVNRRCAVPSVKDPKPTGRVSPILLDAEGEGDTVTQEALQDKNDTALTPINAPKAQPHLAKEPTQKPARSPDGKNEVSTLKIPSVTAIPRIEDRTTQGDRDAGNAKTGRTETIGGEADKQLGSRSNVDPHPAQRPLDIPIKVERIIPSSPEDTHWEAGDSLEEIALKIHLVTAGTRLEGAERTLANDTSSPTAVKNKEQMQKDFDKASIVRPERFSEMATWMLKKLIGDPGFRSCRASLLDSNHTRSHAKDSITEDESNDRENVGTEAMNAVKEAYQQFQNSRTQPDRLRCLMLFHERRKALWSNLKRIDSTERDVLKVVKKSDPQEMVKTSSSRKMTVAWRWLVNVTQEVATERDLNNKIEKMKKECKIGGHLRAIQQVLGDGALLFIGSKLQKNLGRFDGTLFPAFMKAINVCIGPQLRKEVFEQAAQATGSKVRELADILDAMRHRSDIIKNSIAESGDRVDKLLDKIRSGDMAMNDEDEVDEELEDLSAEDLSHKALIPPMPRQTALSLRLTPTRTGEETSGATNEETLQTSEIGIDAESITVQPRKRKLPTDGAVLNEQFGASKKVNRDFQGMIRSSEKDPKKHSNDISGGNKENEPFGILLANMSCFE